MFRSLCVSQNVREFQVQDVLYLQKKNSLAHSAEGHFTFKMYTNRK